MMILILKRNTEKELARSYCNDFVNYFFQNDIEMSLNRLQAS